MNLQVAGAGLDGGNLMVKLNTVIEVLKGLVGIPSILLFAYHNYLYGVYAKEGTVRPDAVHAVLINDHGSYSYITQAQSNCLWHLGVISSFLFLIGLILHFVVQPRLSK